MAESLRLGQDANWDLQNYHFYNAYAFMNGRLGFDVAPAMQQSFHNPLADLAFYAMVRSGFAPRAIEVAMAIPAGIAAFFLLRLLAGLFPRDMPDRGLFMGLAFTVGMTGAAGRGVIGSTMNEWPCTALVIAAVAIVARSIARRVEPAAAGLAVAGFCAGAAMGLKLTYGPYGLALCVAGASFGAWPVRVRRFLWLAGFGAAGLAATYGFWAATLQREFSNPFFPYFNGIFQSPWWETLSIHDERYGPRNAWQALAYPLLFGWNGRIADDANFRDFRLAALLVLAVACLARRAWRAPDRTLFAEPAWRFVSVFTLVAYVAWLGAFGIYRYAIPIEMLSGALVVACVMHLVAAGKLRRRVAVGLALVLVASTMKPNWGRLEPQGDFFGVKVPEVGANALVVLEPQRPLAHLAPFFPVDARFVAPVSNFLAPDQGNLLARRATTMLQQHRGPMYALDHPGSTTIDSLLERYSLHRDAEHCRPVESRIAREPLRLCPIARDAS